MPHRFENINFKRTFSSLTKEVITSLQKQENERNEKDFNSLRENLKKNKCYLCGKPIEEWDENNPCFHFLLNPQLKKKARNALFSKPISFCKLYTYLAWVANTEQPLVNINDILSDISSNRLFESTIRYKNIEWSFSFKQSDLEGHKGAKVGEHPHYHFRMDVDGKPIINFSQHIQFTPEDFLTFEILKQKVAVADPQFSSGLETLKNSVFVEIQEDESVVFTEANSENSLYRTIVRPGTLNIAQLEEIGARFETSNKCIYQIIEELNKEKGYRIDSITFSTQRENPVKKIRRE